MYSLLTELTNSPFLVFSSHDTELMLSFDEVGGFFVLCITSSVSLDTVSMSCNFLQGRNTMSNVKTICIGSCLQTIHHIHFSERFTNSLIIWVCLIVLTGIQICYVSVVEDYYQFIPEFILKKILNIIKYCQISRYVQNYYLGNVSTGTTGLGGRQ